MEALTDVIGRLSLSDGSKKNIDSNFRMFSRFCRQFSLSPLPTENSTLVKYVAYSVAVENRSVGTIRNHLSSIRRAHLSSGHDIPTPSQHFPLQEIIRGARRYANRPVRKTAPITPSILSAILPLCEMGSPFKCLLLILFTTFARLASLIPTRLGQQFSQSNHLSWGDVKFTGDFLKLSLTRTNTIQFGERSLEFLLPYMEDRRLCPGYNLLLWFERCPDKARTSPVFQLGWGRTYKALTRQMVDPIYKTVLRLSGEDPTKYGWSSFRRGGATTYYLATGDVETLRVQGDWQSGAYREYLALPSNQRAGLVRVLLGGINLR